MRRAPLLLLVACAGASPDPLVVLAPEHARAALQRIAWEWGERAGRPVQVVYGPPAQLTHLVDTGAVADVILAPTADVARLEAAGHLAPASRRVIVGDQLVVARSAEVEAPPLTRPSDLAGRTEGAVGVAAEGTALGAASRTQLTLAGVAEALAPRLQTATGGAELVSGLRRGELAWAVLEGSRARAEPDLQVALVLTEGAGAAPLLYEAAAVAHSRSPEQASAFVEHLTEEPTRAAFVRTGWVSRARGGAQPSPPTPGPPTAPPGPPPPPGAAPAQPAAK